jgi:(2R)-3-sulfolactate dehydrogenase (NADP+)
MMTLKPAEADELVVRALTACGTSRTNAQSTAAALVGAQIDGQAGHGLSRVPGYAAQVKTGKVDGHAVPALTRTRTATVQIDAKGGFAYPALDLAIEALPALTREAGVASAAIVHSHHIGQAGRTVERLAQEGVLALVVSNTPSAMAFPGGARPMMGTNPVAFAAPLAGRAPLVIDLALSRVARSKIIAAQKAGQTIPQEWATDPSGRPTTDPGAALAGALAPAGDIKGAALALMVEILCGALAGGHYGWQASSFLDDRGPSPGVGQVLVAFDPSAFGEVSDSSPPSFSQRMADLLAAMANEPGVRLPGERRLAHREQARLQGIALSSDLHAQISALGTIGAAP